MRVLALLAALLLASPALAQFGGRAEAAPAGTVAEQLDYWFARLGEAADAAEAARIDREIQQLWLQSGSATVDLLIDRAMTALDDDKTTEALDLLDGIIALAPDYAEAWHRRAIVHYTTGDYAAAIDDVEHTLRLEPRHFGALAGLGQIYARIGDDTRALAALNAALAIHPFMAGTEDLAAELDARLHRDA